MIDTQVSRPMRSASASGPMGWLKPSFAIVSIASGSATPSGERVHGLVDERHEDAVGDEAREVVRLGRCLAELSRQVGDGGGGLVRRLRRADDLDERHDGHGVEEVHADHAVGPAGRGRQRGDRDGGGVGREDRVRRKDAVGCPEDRFLHRNVFHHGLDHELGLDDAVHGLHTREHLVRVGAALLRQLLEAAPHRLQAALDRSRGRVVERDATA